jgi:hypothetical protein
MDKVEQFEKVDRWIHDAQQMWRQLVDENSRGIVGLGIPKEYIGFKFMIFFSILNVVLPLMMCLNFYNTAKELYNQYGKPNKSDFAPVVEETEKDKKDKKDKKKIQ